MLRWISKDAGNENDAIPDYDIGFEVTIQDDGVCSFIFNFVRNVFK